MPEEKNLFQFVNTAQKILIILKGILDKFDLDSLDVLLDYLQSKKVASQILCIDKQSNKIEEYAKELGFEISYELKPSEYVVTIDYASSGVEKVVYDTDKENGKLIFKIMPSKTGFSFDNVQFQEGSGKFDRTILIGESNPKDLGKFYDDNEYLFKESSYIKYGGVRNIVDTLLNSEVVLDQVILDKITKVFLSTTNLIEGYPEKDMVIDLINAVHAGGNLSNAINSKYYKKPKQYIDIYSAIFSNIKTSGEVIYSIVRKENLPNFTFDDVMNFGRIPFNVVGDYKLALILFELEDNKMYLVVESNDTERFNASIIAGVFDGKGDMGHAYCKVDNMSYTDMSSRFWPILKDLYNVEISSLSDSKIVDNAPKVLTKRHKHSKLNS